MRPAIAIAFFLFIYIVIPYWIHKKRNVRFLTAFLFIFALTAGVPLTIAAFFTLDEFLKDPTAIAVVILFALGIYILGKQILFSKQNKVDLFSFRLGENPRISIEHPVNWTNSIVKLDGNEIGTIKDEQELKKGKKFTLPDDSILEIKMVTQFPFTGLQINHNQNPLPGTFGHPEQIAKTAGVYGIFFGVVNILSFLLTADTGAVSSLGYVYYEQDIAMVKFITLDLAYVVGLVIPLVFTVSSYLVMSKKSFAASNAMLYSYAVLILYNPISFIYLLGLETKLSPDVHQVYINTIIVSLGVRSVISLILFFLIIFPWLKRWREVTRAQPDTATIPKML